MTIKARTPGYRAKNSHVPDNTSGSHGGTSAAEVGWFADIITTLFRGFSTTSLDIYLLRACPYMLLAKKERPVAIDKYKPAKTRI
jgi:hypothetical protein